MSRNDWRATLCMVLLGACSAPGGGAVGEADDAVIDTDDTEVVTDTAPPPGPTDTGAPPETGTAMNPYADVALLSLRIPPYGDDADVYHPVMDTPEPLPTVVFLQGADVGRVHYQEIGSRLAAYGYLVVVPDHQRSVLLLSGLYPEVGQIDACLAAVESEASTAGSPLEGLFDPSLAAVAGHSLGGVAAIEAVADECSSFLCTSGSYTLPPAVKAAVTYGSNRKPPVGSIPRTDNGGTPILLIQGARDGSADPDDTLETYDKIDDPPKALMLVDGGNHYSVTDVQNPPGAIADSKSATLDQQAGLELLAAWMGRYLDAYVRQDPSAQAFFPSGSSEPESGVTLSVAGP